MKREDKMGTYEKRRDGENMERRRDGEEMERRRD